MFCVLICQHNPLCHIIIQLVVVGFEMAEAMEWSVYHMLQGTAETHCTHDLLGAGQALALQRERYRKNDQRVRDLSLTWSRLRAVWWLCNVSKASWQR